MKPEATAPDSLGATFVARGFWRERRKILPLVPEGDWALDPNGTRSVGRGRTSMQT